MSDLKKGISQFLLIGKPIINDYTFKIDEENASNSWKYSMLNLGINCGDYGTVYCEMMGGYGLTESYENLIYVHGKKKNEDGKMVDDWKDSRKIAWEDRLNEDLYDEIGDNCFITIHIENDAKGNKFIKKFLTEYDAIGYIEKHLTEDMIVCIKGKFEYSDYNGTQVKKKIQSIFLSKAKEESDFRATFSQTILVDKDSLGKLDKDKNTYPIDGYIVEYVHSPKIDGKKVVIKENCLFLQEFEFEVKDIEKTKRLVERFFAPNCKTVFEITVDGIISSGKKTISATYNDLPDDIKALVDAEALTEEEALERCVGYTGGSSETFIIKNPRINKAKGDEPATIAFDKDKYTTDDFIMYHDLLPDSEDSNEDDELSENDFNDADIDDILNVN